MSAQVSNRNSGTGVALRTVKVIEITNDLDLGWNEIPNEAGPGTSVRAQRDELQLNRAANPMFDFLRTNGFSLDDIAAVARTQKKGHLVRSTELDPLSANLTDTLHHNFYCDIQDRMPRLRAGNAHAYNLQVDNSAALAARSIREARVATISVGAGRLVWAKADWLRTSY